MRKNEEDQAAKLIQMMSSILLGGIVALAICLLILVICSICISTGFLSDRAMMQYTVAGCVIGGFVGGLFAVVRIRAKTLLIGLGAAIIQFLLIMTIGFLVYSDVSISEHGIGIAAGCLAGGALAGFLGGKPKKKRRK